MFGSCKGTKSYPLVWVMLCYVMCIGSNKDDSGTLLLFLGTFIDRQVALYYYIKCNNSLRMLLQIFSQNNFFML